MLWSSRSTRHGADSSPNGEAAPGSTRGVDGPGQSGSSGIARQEPAANRVPGEKGTDEPPVETKSSRFGPHFSGKSLPEAVLCPQPSAAGGVPEDMATLVLDNPAVGMVPALHPAVRQGTGPRGGRGEAPQAEEGWELEGKAGAIASDPASDAAVMLKVAAGDEVAFNFLVQKYHRPMIHFLFRMVHNQAVAEELAQEVFLRVYRSRSSYRAEAKFSTWLYRIATNLAVNHARDTRHERAAQNVYLDAPDEETGTTPDVADDEPTVEQKLVREERMAAIRSHVMALPERQRMAVLMHKYQGMDYRQIGDVLKLSESATKSLLFRAYQTLRDRLKDFV